MNLRELQTELLAAPDLAAQLAVLHELASGEGVDELLGDIAKDDGLPVRVRREAALLLAGIGGEVAYQTFLDLLDSEEEDIRLAAL